MRWIAIIVVAYLSLMAAVANAESRWHGKVIGSNEYDVIACKSSNTILCDMEPTATETPLSFTQRAGYRTVIRRAVAIVPGRGYYLIVMTVSHENK